MSMNVSAGGWARRPAVAGTFYPAHADELRAAVHRHLHAAVAWAGPVPKAVIAPHAGYVYSGPVAGTAYAAAGRARGEVRRVLLAGPAHRAPVAGVATTSASTWDTPLGSVTIDSEARDLALAVPGVVVDDAAHGEEHSLEVHLPFIQEVFDAVTVLPLVVGPEGPAVLGAVLDALWGGAETLIVVSTDLSHYLDQTTAQARDRRTASAIVSVSPSDIGGRDACGAAPVKGLLLAARRRGLSVSLLDLRTSADTAGPPDRVVGYGAFALAE